VEAEVVVHLVVHLVMTLRAKMAQVRVRPPKNQDTRRATAMVVVEEAEVMIPTVRTWLRVPLGFGNPESRLERTPETRALQREGI